MAVSKAAKLFCQFPASMRSQRELNNLQYFDPEKFDVKIEPNQTRNTVDITYVVSEK